MDIRKIIRVDAVTRGLNSFRQQEINEINEATLKEIDHINNSITSRINEFQKEIGYKSVTTKKGNLYVSLDTVSFAGGFAFVTAYDINGNTYLGFINENFEEQLVTFKLDSSFLTLGFEIEKEKYNVRTIGQGMYIVQVLNTPSLIDSHNQDEGCSYHLIGYCEGEIVTIITPRNYAGYDNWENTLEGTKPYIEPNKLAFEKSEEQIIDK